MTNTNDETWQEHAMQFLENAFRVDRQKRVPNADGYGKQNRACGDTIEIFLSIQDDYITTAAYSLKGCINTNACANAVIHLIEGQPVSKAWELSPEMVAAFLHSLPEDHLHCAELAVDALRAALADAREKRKAPWKKLYK